jgi:hypothetical protein
MIREADTGTNSAEVEQPVESINCLRTNRPRMLRALMEFYEADQVPEEETEVDLMVQLSGMVHGDWRIED